MAQVVGNTKRVWSSVDGRAQVYKLRRLPSRNVIRSHHQTVASELAILGLIVAILQITDGILTAVGMAHFGTHMEGNAFLRFLMQQMGYIPALMFVKSIAIGVVAGLCIYASRVVWLRHALRGVIAMYVLLAVLPWTYLLASHFVL